MFNNYRKFGKFDIGSDIQNATFSEKLDKNNWTQTNGLSHPGSRGIFFDKNPPKVGPNYV